MGDARRIRQVTSITSGLTKILALAPVRYKNRASDSKVRFGFISQDFGVVFPDLVSRRPEDNGIDPLPPEAKPPGIRGWSVESFEPLIPFIVAAIKELHEDMKTFRQNQKKRLDDAEARIATLEAKAAALEARLLALEPQ